MRKFCKTCKEFRASDSFSTGHAVCNDCRAGVERKRYLRERAARIERNRLERAM